MSTGISILAFTFASPWLLGGLALGAVPIIIHLLYKRRYREVPWAAMRFLIEATRKNARRLRLEQVLLLAVRVLILMLLVLALARPQVESFGSFLAGDSPVHRILVVDTSFSMGFQGADASRFERARRMTREIASNAQQGDALNLVQISALGPNAIIAEPSYNRDLLIEEIDGLRQTDEKGMLAPALEEVLDILKKAPELRQKEVYIISDFQRGMWSAMLPQLRERLDEISERGRVVFFDVARERAANVAVTNFAVEEAFVTTGRPVQLVVALQSWGAESDAQRTVELHVNGKLVDTQQVVLPGEGEARASFTYTFERSGEHRLEARVPGDALEIDNHRWLALPVRDELNVLLVDGRPAGKRSESATHYVRTVLAPTSGSAAVNSLMRPHVISDGELPGTDLSRYDCVFLCNVGLLTEREAQLLAGYASSGGGVVVALGDQVRAENYNQLLYRDAKGLLPARLGERRGNAQNPQEAFLFDPGDLSHPIVNQFQGNPGTGLESTMAFEYFCASLPEDSSVNVILRFDTGDPALVEAPFGRGRVVLITTALDQRWGPWPLQASFPPMIHETVRHVVAGQWAERQKQIGEPLGRSYALAASASSAIISRPDGAEATIAVIGRGEKAEAAYNETDRAGIYELRLPAPQNRTEVFAVNVDPAESDLSAVSERELNSALFPGTKFVYQTEWHPFPGETASAAAERSALSRWMLWAVVCLVFVEQLMAWRFAYGLVLLVGLVAVAFTLQAFAAGPVIGAAFLICLAAAGAVLGVLANRRGLPFAARGGSAGWRPAGRHEQIAGGDGNVR